jgi:hypothetical protein
VKVAYQAKNMSWRVDYRVRVNAAGDRLDLAGWVTVTNNTGASFRNARLKLLAGDVHVVQPEMMYLPRMAPPAPGPGGGGGGGFTEKAFSEYHLYELGRQATLRDQETKQIELLDVRQVPVRRQYQVGGDGKVAVTLEFKNSAQTAVGLGVPLPKGPIRVFQRDADGELELAGLDQIDHTPKDEPLRFHLGHATDLTGRRKETAYQRQGQAGELYDIEVRLRNHKTEPVTIDVVETIHGSSDATVLKHSHPYTQRDVNTLVFPVQVQPNAEVVLTYTVHYVQPVITAIP